MSWWSLMRRRCRTRSATRTATRSPRWWRSPAARPLRLAACGGLHASRWPLQCISRAGLVDLLLLSGGVSVGRHDLVEDALAAEGAEFFFTGVRMQPGRPVVFGRIPARGQRLARYFFGLPGNPVSTQVTFLVFVCTLLAALGGAGAQPPQFAARNLSEEVA